MRPAPARVGSASRTTNEVVVSVLMLAIGCEDVDLGGRRVIADAAQDDIGTTLDGGPPGDDADADAGTQSTDAGVDATVIAPDAHTEADLAVVVAHTLPTSLACAATTTVSVTMRNVGDTTWTSSANYVLGAVNPEDLFLTSGDRVALGADVAPGGERTFDIVLSAPGAGTYPTQWRMVRGGFYAFGEVATSDVDVVCAGPFRVFPAVIDGRFDMPPHEQRIASRDASLLRTGNVITGDDDIDNAVLGGGSPDGGIWLSGTFHFEIDAAGQNTAASWITVFSDERFPVNGGIYPNGEIHMGSPAGLDISGLFKNGVVTGYVAEAGQVITRDSDIWSRLPMADQNYIRGIWHGADLEYVHGVMSGTGVVP